MNLIILLLQAAQSNVSILDLIIIFCIWLHSTTPIIANPCHHNFWNLVSSTHPQCNNKKYGENGAAHCHQTHILWWNVALYLCDYGKSLLNWDNYKTQPEAEVHWWWNPLHNHLHCWELTSIGMLSSVSWSYHHKNGSTADVINDFKNVLDQCRTIQVTELHFIASVLK